MAAAKDGSVQLSLGLGKYTNRGVMDAYAGISRGVEQWTVRASRALAPDPETASVGPDPLRGDRAAARGPLRARPERRAPDQLRVEALGSAFRRPWRAARFTSSRDRYRIDADIIRYHHGGTARGWVEIDGERTSSTDDLMGLDP